MTKNLKNIVAASLLPAGWGFVGLFETLGHQRIDALFLSAVCAGDERTWRTCALAGWEPEPATLARLAMAQRHGDRVSRRAANVVANIVAVRCHTRGPTAIEEALLDARDLACA